MWRIAVCLGINRHRLQAELAAGVHGPQRNLSTIGDEHPLHQLRLLVAGSVLTLAEQKIILQHSFFQFLIIKMTLTPNAGRLQGHAVSSRSRGSGGPPPVRETLHGGPALKVIAVMATLELTQQTRV